MERTIIVGDIHGEYEKLLKLTPVFEHMQKVIFCGDLIDRGPQPLEVMKHVLEVPNAVILEGNHEFKYKKKIKAGKVSHPKEIKEENFSEFKDLLERFYKVCKTYYKDEYLAVSHAPAALYQHDWSKIPFDKFLYAWTSQEKDEHGFPKRIMLNDKYPNEVSEKPIIYGHTHYKKLVVNTNEYCVDYDCGNSGGLLCGAIFEDGRFVDSVFV